MPHPEVPSPSCMSCGKSLLPGDVMGFVYSNKAGVPDEVDCCGRCWAKVPVNERLKIVLAIRDRQHGGIVSMLAEMAEQTLLEHRENLRDH